MLLNLTSTFPGSTLASSHSAAAFSLSSSRSSEQAEMHSGLRMHQMINEQWIDRSSFTSPSIPPDEVDRHLDAGPEVADLMGATRRNEDRIPGPLLYAPGRRSAVVAADEVLGRQEAAVSERFVDVHLRGSETDPGLVVPDVLGQFGRVRAPVARVLCFVFCVLQHFIEEHDTAKDKNKKRT